jgi:hypothetical protein
MQSARLRGDSRSVLFALTPPFVQSVALLLPGHLHATKEPSVKSLDCWRAYKHLTQPVDLPPSIDFNPRLQRRRYYTPSEASDPRKRAREHTLWSGYSALVCR